MEKSLLSSRNGEFYDQWESASEEARQEHMRARLGEYVAMARATTPFYRERLDGFDLSKTNPMQHVPVLESSDLRANLPVAGSGLLSRETPYFTVFQSGGTTGMPKTSLFAHEELEGLNLPNARGFYAVGLRETDRVANLFAVGGLYMTFVHINRMLQQFGCTNFPFSNQTPVDFINTVVRSFNVNCFTGIASVVLNALREMHKMDATGLKIDKIYYGGEHVYEADKNEMREKLGVELVAAPGYGTVDTWYLGYQCKHTETGCFHAHDDQVYIEIVDEDDGTLCPPDKVGMMYATAFERKLTPIVRYRVGDKAVWLEERCQCGRTTPVYKLLGRGDDVLRIGYDSIDYNAIQDLAARQGGLTAMIQMQKKRVDGQDLLIIRAESEAPVERRAELASRFVEALLDDRPSLRDFMKKGTVLAPKVEIVGLGELPLNPRTGKLIRVIDAI